MRYLALIPLILTGLAITGCLERGDSDQSAPVVDSRVTPNSFLTYINQSLDINSPDYANAYYKAVDPADERTTLAEWKDKVDFNQGDVVHATFRDTKDLGYGRDMYAKKGWLDCDTCVAIYVDNYIVEIEPGDATSYGPLNLPAAIEQDREFLFGTNVIEFSHENDDTNLPKIVKFFTYGPNDNNGVQQRLISANLDGRGKKYMPTMCVVCHGATLYPLTQEVKFDALSLKSPKLNMLEQHTFQFSTTPGYTEADQAYGISAINQMVLNTYREMEMRDDSTTDQANWSSEFAVKLMETTYGVNPGEDISGEDYQADSVPSGWLQTSARPGGIEVLYKQVIEPYCIGCHSSRGTKVAKLNAANAVNFSTYEEFIAYNDLIIDYVYKRGSMPDSLISFSQFWDNPDGAPTLLATYLPGFDVFDANDNVVIPGKAVAKPGADRTVASTPVTLDSFASYFSTAYTWRIVSSSIPGAALVDPLSPAPQLTADDGAVVVLELITSNAMGSSQPAQVTITVDSLATPDEPTFVSDISSLLETNCASCHSATPNPPNTDYTGIPIYYDAASYTDPKDLYYNVLNRADLVDPENSLLLRKPTSGSSLHGGGLRFSPTDPEYITLLNWIRNGAPCKKETDVDVGGLCD
jgi:mono/diheme cytochrome c family protein